MLETTLPIYVYWPLKDLYVDNVQFFVDYLAACVACSCSSGLSLVTPATISSTVHCRVALREGDQSKFYQCFRWLNMGSFIQFMWLPAGFETVLEAEKSPLPETQPRFSFWTFGHLSWPCGAPRWPPLFGGEVPATTKECKSKTHYFYPSSLIINMSWKKNTHISVLAFIFKAVQTYGILRHL